MNFLDAKTAEVIWRSEKDLFKRSIHSDTKTEQMVVFDFKTSHAIMSEEVVLTFDVAHKAPLKFSLSANQYTMDLLTFDVKLFRANEENPYSVVELDELRTILKLLPNTEKIVISCNKEKCDGKSAKVKFSVNYIEY